MRLLVCAFAPSGEIIIGLDDTIERRSRRTDRSSRDLSRPSALLEILLRQDQRKAMVVLPTVAERAEGAVTNRAIWATELHAVEGIEELGAELDVPFAFVEIVVLDYQSEITGGVGVERLSNGIGVEVKG